MRIIRSARFALVQKGFLCLGGPDRVIAPVHAGIFCKELHTLPTAHHGTPRHTCSIVAKDYYYLIRAKTPKSPAGESASNERQRQGGGGRQAPDLCSCAAQEKGSQPIINPCSYMLPKYLFFLR